MAKKPAKKYEHLKGTVPAVPDVAPGTDRREDAIRAFMDGNPRAQAMERAVAEGRELTPREAAFPEGPRNTWSADDLTREYNALEETKKKIGAAEWAVKVQLDANERLIRKAIEGLGADKITINGYTWSPSSQPYPSVDDPAALVQHYIDNGLQSMLTVHPSRVLSHVKEEIEANTLKIEVKEGAGPEGEDVTEVRSNLPGVKVYLAPSMSRRKSGAAATQPEGDEE